MAGTSTSVVCDAVFAAPLSVKWTCIVSSAQVTFGGMVPGQAAPGASEEKNTGPDVAMNVVTDPFAPTCMIRPFTRPVPSPIVALTEAGGVVVAFCAKPLTSTRAASVDGLSKPT